MGYEGKGRLPALFQEIEKLVDPTCREITDGAGERMTKIVKDNTPIADPLPAEFLMHLRKKPPVPGTLRESIQQKDLVLSFENHETAYESGAETDVNYAPYVEEGTGLWGPKHDYYEIRPKTPGGVLVFPGRDIARGVRFNLSTGSYQSATPELGLDGGISTSGIVHARRVMSPGSPGQHMFALGAQMTEHYVDEIASEPLRKFAAKVDAIHV